MADLSTQTIINWVVGGCTVAGGWLFRRHMTDVDLYKQKVDVLEHTAQELASKTTAFVPSDRIATIYATQAQIVAIEARLAGMVSRKEFMAYLRQFADDSERKHKENMDRLDRNLDDIHEARNDTRALHARIDELFSK